MIGEDARHRATTNFLRHYDRDWNHQGLDNKLLWPKFLSLPTFGAIGRRNRLGGLLHYDYREAA